MASASPVALLQRRFRRSASAGSLTLGVSAAVQVYGQVSTPLP
jgi:hypothetical protein